MTTRERSDLHYQGWILGLLVAVAMFGFIIGIFAYVTTFLRAKAGVRWHWAVVGALGAVALMCIIGHFLVLNYPSGLLQSVADLPWPFD